MRCAVLVLVGESMIQMKNLMLLCLEGGREDGTLPTAGKARRG